MIALSDHVQLARRVRLRFDERTHGWLLIYPERGLALSPTAADILKLCDGTRSVAQVVAALAARYEQACEQTLSREVSAFLETLAQRSLVECVARAAGP